MRNPLVLLPLVLLIPVLSGCVNSDPDYRLLCAAHQHYFQMQTALGMGSSDATIRDQAITSVRTKYQILIDSYPTSQYADDAQYMIAKATQYTRDATLTRAEYQKLIDVYPDQYLHPLTIQYDLSWTPLKSGTEATVSGDQTSRHNWLQVYWQTDMEAIQSTPVAALAQFWIGQLYNDPNYFPDSVDPEQAVIEFTKVTNSYPGTRIAAAAQFQIAAEYRDLNDFESSIAAYRILIDNYPGETFLTYGAYDRIGGILATLRDYTRIDQYAAELANRYSPDNYVAESTAWSLFRVPPHWSRTHLTVGLDETIPAAKREIIFAALEEWSKGTNRLITFEYVPNGFPREYSYGPGVDIYIKHGSQPLCHGNVGGDEGICWMWIDLDCNATDDRFSKSCLHELGHALGLGHSFNRYDIMTNIGTGTDGYLGDGRPTPRDKNTVIAIYS